MSDGFVIHAWEVMVILSETGVSMGYLGVPGGAMTTGVRQGLHCIEYSSAYCIFQGIQFLG